MKEIPLTQGYVALVSDEDFERVNAFKWNAAVSRRNGLLRVYAKRKIRIDRKWTTLRMHRFILGCAEDIDHADHNGLNNQRDNLRPATNSQNGANRAKSTNPASSKWKGVCWRKDLQRWNAYIYVDQARRHLGHFKEECDAALAYNLAASMFFGEFAQYNVPIEATA